MSKKPAQIIRVSIHGNIGVGKTTLILNATRKFASHPSIRVVAVPEPTEAWVRSGALRALTSDFEHWGVAGQYILLGTRCTYARMKEEDVVRPCAESGAVETVVVLYERSLVDDREIFARRAIVTKDDWRLYEQLVARINSTEYNDIKRMVYLRNSATACKKHVEERGRDGEDNYDLAWLEDLDLRHEQMVEQAKNNVTANGPDVVTIDYADGMHNDTAFIEKLILDIVDNFGSSD